MPKELSDMTVDEISIVDVPAAQHSRIVIAKRHNPGETRMPSYFTEDGTEYASVEEIEAAGLAEGTPVWSSDNETDEADLVWTAADTAAAQAAAEVEPVGKSAFGAPAADVQPGSISKALGDIISKATSLEEVQKNQGAIVQALSLIEKRAEVAEQLAETETDRRRTAEYVELAKSYSSLPVHPDDLGPALMEVEELCSPETVQVFAKALAGANSVLFEEFGYVDGGAEPGPASEIDAAVQQVVEVAKSQGLGVNAEVAKGLGTEAFYGANPAAYDEVLAGLRRG